jgi:hypothetical protein
MVTDSPELMAAVNNARQLSSEQTANIFTIALAGARGRYFEWFVAQQTGSGRYAQIVLVTDCYALNICTSFPNRHVVLSAVCDTGCSAKWLPPQQDYTWATIDRKHHGFRLLTKDAERKVVWTYWNITSVAADDFKASSEVQKGARVPQSQYVEDRQAYLTNHPDKADWKQRADKACLSSDVYFDEDDGARMRKCSDRPWKPQHSDEAKAEAVKTPSPSNPQLSAASKPDGDIVAALHSDKQNTLPLATKTAYMIKREGKYFIEDRLDGLLPNDVVLFSDSTCTVDPSIHAPGWDYVSVCRGQVWEKWLTRRPGDVYWIGWKNGEDYTTSVRYKGNGTTEKVSVTVDKTFDNTPTEYAAVIDGWDTDNGALKEYTLFVICSKRFPDCHKLTAGATYSLTTVEDNDPAAYQPGAPTSTTTNGKQDKVLGSIRLTGDDQSVVYYIDSLTIKDQQGHVLDSVQVE